MTHESDEVLDALEAVVVPDVLRAVPRAQRRAGGLQVGQPGRHGGGEVEVTTLDDLANEVLPVALLFDRALFLTG